LTVQFSLEYDQIRILEEKMKQLPDKMEPVVNETLHGFGITTAIEEITKLIPVSSRKGRKRNKTHARTSLWSRSLKENLGFKIISKGGAAKNKGSFSYLVFPNEGRGSHNPLEQRFAERGMNAATPKILNKLNDNIDQVLRRDL